jgi:hypothetical protein
MSRFLLLVPVVVATLAGCGGGGDGVDTATTTYRSSLSASNGEELEHDKSREAQGVEGQSVCTLIPTAEVERTVGVTGLKAERSDSLDLSSCRYAKGDVNVRVILDGAADATRRYYNQQSEAYQKFNTVPDLKPHNVRHVGDDSTYGNAGAYWTIGRAQLVAFKDDRIARVTVFVPGRSDARRKAQAGELARLLFARMTPARGE